MSNNKLVEPVSEEDYDQHELEQLKDKDMQIALLQRRLQIEKERNKNLDEEITELIMVCKDLPEQFHGMRFADILKHFIDRVQK